MCKPIRLFLVFMLLALAQPLIGQPVTGVWRGKMQKGRGLGASIIKLELKLVKQGDSLLGTAYYFLNTKNFFRYSVRGYFDNRENAVHWWDVRLVETFPSRRDKGTEVYKMPMVSRADFNCPSGEEMRLDGESGIGGAMNLQTNLEKVSQTFFKDEWDDVIAGYFTGMARGEIIDSVWAINGKDPALETIAKNNPKPIEIETDGPASGTLARRDPPARTSTSTVGGSGNSVSVVDPPVAVNEKKAVPDLAGDSNALAKVSISGAVETNQPKAQMPSKTPSGPVLTNTNSKTPNRVIVQNDPGADAKTGIPATASNSDTQGTATNEIPAKPISAPVQPDPKTVAKVDVPESVSKPSTQEIAGNTKPETPVGSSSQPEKQTVAKTGVPASEPSSQGSTGNAKPGSPAPTSSQPDPKTVAKVDVPAAGNKPPNPASASTAKVDKPTSQQVAKVDPAKDKVNTPAAKPPAAIAQAGNQKKPEPQPAKPVTGAVVSASKPVVVPKTTPTIVSSSPGSQASKPVSPPATAQAQIPAKTPVPVVAKVEPAKEPTREVAKVAQPQLPPVKPVMQEEFTARQKVVQTEIPAVGDSIELQFYDNAEVDGDSISLFLNGKMLFQHVRLSVQAYTFKIAVTDLPPSSELTMVAENLGAIPPNTAFMVAWVEGRQYTARIESTETSSGVIKLVRR